MKKTTRKPRGFWTENRTINELQSITKNLNHFPTHNELSLINRDDLVGAIHRNGGLNKFRQLMGYELLQKPRGYWNVETIVIELKSVIDTLHHFPTTSELSSIDRVDLQVAINRNGGINKFKKILGYDISKVSNGFWTDETIIQNLNEIEKDIGHFPTKDELISINRQDLCGAIESHGGYPKFRKLFGFDYLYKPDGFWSDETIIKELYLIIDNIGHFPTQKELHKLKKDDLIGAIQSHGGINKFRKLTNSDIIKKSKNFWSDETIVIDIKNIENSIGHFPSTNDLISMNKSGLVNAIRFHGGMNKFRKLTGNIILKNSEGYWTDEIIINDLQSIMSSIGHFPSASELISIDRQDLFGAIASHGGYPKFKSLLGYTISMQEKYISELASYTIRRGKSSEKLVNKILIDYCTLHNLPSPSYNVKLSIGNVIEFVCDTSKKIGIDVTNTQNKSVVKHKWTRKDYHSYLNELWIVVMSDSFSSQDYHKWNQESPDNVKVMSIYQFIEELDYSLDEHTKSKIDNYCKCTFHTKEEFIKYKSSNSDKDTLHDAN